MALSGDASCNGLYSAREGQTLQLKEGKVKSVRIFSNLNTTKFNSQQQEQVLLTLLD